MNYLKIFYKPSIYCFINICFAISVFSQCPQSGLKIISKDCENPKGLAVVPVNCTEIKVKWLGSKSQNYIVKSSVAYANAESATALKVSEAVCDNNGNCTAIIEVSEGSTIDWSVEAICTTKGITTYSEAVNGPQTYIPICNKKPEVNSTTGLQAYPSPSKGDLTVEYNGLIEGVFYINIYNVSGKQVFSKSVTATNEKSNQFKLNLHSLASGTYLIKTINGPEILQTKFVLLTD